MTRQDKAKKVISALVGEKVCGSPYSAQWVGSTRASAFRDGDPLYPCENTFAVWSSYRKEWDMDFICPACMRRYLSRFEFGDAARWKPVVDKALSEQPWLI